MSAHTISKRENEALQVNYPPRPGQHGAYINFSGGSADIAITTHGSDWYWAVTAVMMVATLVFVGLSHTKKREHRLFHYITAAITMVASIAYFTMASGIGWAPISVEFRRSNPKVSGFNREIYYVRYIDWVITTPLLLMDPLLTAGLPWPTLLYTVLIDEIMIVTGLAGALTRSSYKWGYFTFGCVALVWIGWVLIMEARTHANHLGSDIGRVFLLCGAWTFFLWTLYPIAWGLAEGGNVIAPDSEAVFYGVLDICAKPIFGSLLLWGHRNIDPARLGLHIRDYADDPAVTGGTKGHGSTKATTEGSDPVYNGTNNGTNTSATNGAGTAHVDGSNSTTHHTTSTGTTNGTAPVTLTPVIATDNRETV